MNNTKKRLPKIIFGSPIIILVIFIIGLVTLNHWYRLKPGVELQDDTHQILLDLAESALRTRDVPVGAVLCYGNKIIGLGYNTVFADSNAGGHAEINAISDGLHKIGSEKFGRLNHDNLVMISTFEPCAMCRGAMIEYGIDKVLFFKGKTWSHWWSDFKNMLEYHLRKNKVKGGDRMQDSLFIQHPNYPTQH